MQGIRWSPSRPRRAQQLYDLELIDLLKTIQGKQPPARPLAHELLVQETLLRATGEIEE